MTKLFYIVMFVIHQKLSKWWTQTHKEERDTGRWIKHCFLFTAIPIASDRQAVAQGAQSDSNKSTLLPIYKQISLTTTNNRGAAKEEARRTAFGNH